MQRAALPSHRQEVEGSFAIRAEEQTIKASTLAVYGLQCNVAWAGDEPLDLPDEVEELLVDDELKDSRPGVRLLWATLLGIYPTEQARTVAYDTYYGQLHLLRPAALTVASCTQSYCVHTYDAYPADQAVHMRRSLCLHLLWPHFFTAPYTCCSCTCCAYTCCGRTYLLWPYLLWPYLLRRRRSRRCNAIRRSCSPTSTGRTTSRVAGRC